MIHKSLCPQAISKMWHFPYYDFLFMCNISGFTVIEPQTKCLGTGDIKYKRSILKDVS